MSAQVGDGDNQVDGGTRANIQYNETPWERLQLQIEHAVAAARLLVMHLHQGSPGAEYVQGGELVQREVLRIGELADAIEETFKPIGAPVPSAKESDAEFPLYNARVLVDIVLNEIELDKEINAGTRPRIVTLVHLMDEQMRAAEIAIGLGGEQ